MVSGTGIFLWIFIHNRLWSQSQKRFEYVSKTAWELVNKNSLIWWYVLKTSLRHPQDVLKTFLQDILKTFWRRLEDAFKTFLQDLWLRQIYWSWSRRLEDVLKTSLSRRMFAGIIASKCGPLVRIEKQAMSWKLDLLKSFPKIREALV